MPSPPTIPPMHWLRAIFGLITRPTSYAPTMRGTRTVPSNGSTRTSANTAPNAALPNRLVSSPGLASASACTLCSPMPRHQRDHALHIAAARPSAPANPASFWRNAWHAATTALPTLANVVEPPCTGAFGMSVSPSSKSTVLQRHAQRIRRKLRHRGVGPRPHVAGRRAHYHAAIGIQHRLRRRRQHDWRDRTPSPCPSPTTVSPCRIDPGFAERRDQPNRSAAIR